MNSSQRESDDWDAWSLMEGGPFSESLSETYNRRAATLDVTPWELSILEAIWYDFGQVPSRELLSTRSHGRYAKGRLQVSYASIERCFQQNWIQHLSCEFLLKKQQEIENGGYLAPRGLIGTDDTELESMVGLTSFTPAGAELYLSWIKFGPSDPETDHWAIEQHGDGNHTVYGTSLDQCKFVLEDDSSSVIETSPPEKIGRWCDRWWLKFESGYRVQYRSSEK